MRFKQCHVSCGNLFQWALLYQKASMKPVDLLQETAKQRWPKMAYGQYSLDATMQQISKQQTEVLVLSGRHLPGDIAPNNCRSCSCWPPGITGVSSMIIYCQQYFDFKLQANVNMQPRCCVCRITMSQRPLWPTSSLCASNAMHSQQVAPPTISRSGSLVLGKKLVAPCYNYILKI